MRARGLGSVVLEARKALTTVQDKEAQVPVGPLVVSGTLADQLARELGAGAEPGAVVVRDPPSAAGAEVVVRVIAGDPGRPEDALVREADRLGIPVVFVQLWPQASWASLFVLSPFVIECRAGKGFPVETIAETVSRAVANPEALAARVPVLKEPVESSVVRKAVARAALLGGAGARRKGPARPMITLEQLKMASSLRAAGEPEARSEIPPAAVAVATVGASFALRALARTAGRSLPAPLVNAAVAAGGTWALAELLRRLEARG